jgi:hypothetical protein
VGVFEYLYDYESAIALVILETGLSRPPGRCKLSGRSGVAEKGRPVVCYGDDEDKRPRCRAGSFVGILFFTEAFANIGFIGTQTVFKLLAEPILV